MSDSGTPPPKPKAKLVKLFEDGHTEPIRETTHAALTRWKGRARGPAGRSYAQATGYMRAATRNYIRRPIRRRYPARRRVSYRRRRY